MVVMVVGVGRRVLGRRSNVYVKDECDLRCYVKSVVHVRSINVRLRRRTPSTMQKKAGVDRGRWRIGAGWETR